MADLIAVTPGIGANISCDDLGGGLLVQRNKVQFGTDGVATDVSGSNPMPVTTVNAGTFVVQENGSALTALQLIDDIVHAEDAPHGSTDKGVPMLIVRKDSPASLAGTDGDYTIPQCDATGAMRVTGGTAATQYLEDSPHGSGDTGMVMLIVRKDLAGTIAGTDGDYTIPQCDATGAIRVTGGTASTQYAEDSPHGSGDTGTMMLGVRKDTFAAIAGADGDYTPPQFTATGAMRVAIAEDAAGSAVVDEDGSVPIGGTSVAQVVSTDYQYDGSALVRVRGPLTVAHGAADAGNPAKFGAVAETSISGVTLAVDGARTNLYAGVDGVLIVRPNCNLEDIVSGTASNTDGSSTPVITAAGSGIKQYLTSVTLGNSHATTGCMVDIKSGTTVMATLPCPPTFGGATIPFNPPLKPNAANEAWNFDPSAAVTTIYCSMVAFKSKV